jgi:predicted ATPase
MGALHALLGLAPDASLEQRQTRLLRVLAAAELLDWAPIVGGVLGLEIEENPLTVSLDAQMRQQRFFDVVLQILLAQSAQQPLLLVLDDLYWADSASLELIAYVARNIQSSPILFVLLRRPSAQPMSWASGEHYHPRTLPSWMGRSAWSWRARSWGRRRSRRRCSA